MTSFEKSTQHSLYLEDTTRDAVPEENLVYDNDEQEPEVHIRTYLALAAMFLLNLVQVFGLQGPAAVVRQVLLGVAAS